MKQRGFTLIEILVVLAVIIITATGGVFVWQKKVSPPEVITATCQTDADCPLHIPEQGPSLQCINNRCVESKEDLDYEDRKIPTTALLNEEIKLLPGQTASIKGTDLSLTLLQIIPAPKGSFDYPTKAEIKVRSGSRSEKIYFTAGVLATEEVAKKLQYQEVFGFRITRVELRQEWIVLTVEKL